MCRLGWDIKDGRRIVEDMKDGRNVKEDWYMKYRGCEGWERICGWEGM